MTALLARLLRSQREAVPEKRLRAEHTARAEGPRKELTKTAPRTAFMNTGKSAMS